MIRLECRSVSVVACMLLLAAPAGAQQLRNGLVAGGPIAGNTADMPCLTPQQIADIQAQLLRARAELGLPLPSGAATPADAAPQLLPFFPLGGNSNGDIFPGGFVDVDPASPGFQDWSCNGFTYDGHQGTDCSVRSFGEVALGVPVFAALDGTVLLAVDGFTDMNVFPSGDAGNYVILDHGSGRETWYFHMKQNSVAVTMGQPVKAGQQIGLAASSGYSFGPHLHFQSQLSGAVHEPWTGPCNPGTSGWLAQPPVYLTTALNDFGVSSTDPYSVPFYPYEPVKSAQIALADPITYFYIRILNLPIGSDWHVQWFRPDGVNVLDSGPFPFGTTDYIREYWFGWAYDVAQMHSVPGTWHMRLLINGALLVDAPIEVVAVKDPGFNRAPQPVTLALDPPAPVAADALFCRTQGSLTLDDLDWDIVRYRYEWSVNGSLLRDVTTAGAADALRSASAAAGDVIACRVTPGDGKANGPATTRAVTVAPHPWTDLGSAKPGSNGTPQLVGQGKLLGGELAALRLYNAKPSSLAALFVSLTAGSAPFKGGQLVPIPVLLTFYLPTAADGTLTLPFVWPTGQPSGLPFVTQFWISDSGASKGVSASNGLRGTAP